MPIQMTHFERLARIRGGDRRKRNLHLCVFFAFMERSNADTDSPLPSCDRANQAANTMKLLFSQPVRKKSSSSHLESDAMPTSLLEH